jgi:hypothetical protein
METLPGPSLPPLTTCWVEPRPVLVADAPGLEPNSVSWCGGCPDRHRPRGAGGGSGARAAAVRGARGDDGAGRRWRPRSDLEADRLLDAAVAEGESTIKFIDELLPVADEAEAGWRAAIDEALTRC